MEQPPLVEGEDYYWEGAVIVFTAHFLRRRGYCCGSGCRHCPFREEERVADDADRTSRPSDAAREGGAR